MRRTIPAIAIAIAMSLLPLDASADGKRVKYERGKPPLSVEAKVTRHTARLSAAALREKARKVRKVRPTITADDVIRGRGKARPIRASQRRKLIELLRATDAKDPDRPRVLFRLAESHATDHRFFQLEGDEAKAAQALASAVRVYAELTGADGFSRWKRADEALFNYASLLRDAGKPALARTVWKRLLQNHPSSRYVPYAVLAFAEHEFDSSAYGRAGRLYSKLVALPRSSLTDYARYKLGWTQLLTKQPDDALATFFALVRESKDRTLRRGAESGFVRAYAEAGKPRSAFNAFRRLDRDRAPTLLAALAALYFDTGKSASAVYLYRQLIARLPRDARICEWQLTIQQAMLSTNDKAMIVAETVRLGQLYTALARRKTAAAVLTACRDSARDVTSELARLWHREANRTLDLATFAHAAALYEAHIEHFGGASAPGQEKGIMRLYYAELLWAWADQSESQRPSGRRWERAAVAFTRALDHGLRRKRRRDAAHASVLAWKNALQIDPRTQPPRLPSFDEDERPPRRPISDRRQKLIAALERLVKTIEAPADPDRVLAQFLVAREYWLHAHFEAALPRFSALVARHRAHESAAPASHLALNLLIRLHRWRELDRLTDTLLADRRFLADKPGLRERLGRIRVTSLRKRAEAMAKAKRWIGCGKAYLEIIESHPEAEGIDEVLYSAAHCFEQGRSIGYAIDLYRQLQKRYPESAHAKRALVRMGDALGRVAHYAAAARSYETYAKSYGGEELAPKALSQAVTYRLGVGDDDKAIANTELFVSRYRRSKPAAAAEALFSMTAIFEKRGQAHKVIRHLERYLKEGGRAGGPARRIAAHARIGVLQWTASCRRPAADGSCVTVRRTTRLRRRGSRARSERIPTRCGEDDRTVLTVQRRDPALVRKARRHFAAAVAIWREQGKEMDEASRPLAAHWAGAAAFHAVEPEYEAYLALGLPPRLVFDPRRPAVTARSTRQFVAWLGAKKAAAGRADARYREVLRGRSAQWAIAAAARMGQLPQNLADGLYRAEIPAFLRNAPEAERLVDEYCGRLEEEARPLEARSVAAFQMCLGESGKRNWWSSWARLCESELAAVSPEAFPPTDETHGGAAAAAPIVDVSPMIAELAAE